MRTRKITGFGLLLTLALLTNCSGEGTNTADGAEKIEVERLETAATELDDSIESVEESANELIDALDSLDVLFPEEN